MQTTTPCNPTWLNDWLDDALSEEQEEQLARHLADCAICRDALEARAADAREWSQVSDVLQREAAHAASRSGSSVMSLESQEAWTPGVPHSPADFAVHFLEPSQKPETLGRLGDIDILEVIGSGGMGIVLKGFQNELNRPVAVKVLAPHLATSGAARQRFAREAQAAAAIVHPNVMPILTVNSTGRIPYLVMPYVACESLQERLDRVGALDACEVLRVGMQTAAALAAAHAQGIVHRDVKPANILLERGVDRVMLTDFGLARAADDASLTRSGVIAGTPQYMSPEQARGEAVDVRSDLFSLGSVLYTMSAGRPPFRAETSFGILRRITDNRPRDIREINAQIPAWLQAVIFKLLAKEPGDRFASAEELAELLKQCLAHLQQPGAVALPAPVAGLKTAESTHSKHRVETVTARWWRVAVPVAVASLLGLAAFVSWPRGEKGTRENAAAINANAVEVMPRAPTWPDAATPTAGNNTSADSLSAWEFGDETLRQLIQETEELETRVDELWDVAPLQAP